MRRYVAIVITLVSVGLVATSIEARRQAPSASPMAAVGADSPIFTGLHFRLVGPSRGGRSTTVTGVPSEPKTFYMGVASGGVFKTIDGGATWTPMTDGQVPLGSTGSIAVADSDPNVVYLGTGSDAVRSNVSTGHGIYKSIDAGKTWSYVGLYDSGQVGTVRIHPTDPNTAWVAAQGDAFTPSADRGIYKTSDGGKTWRKTLFVANTVGAMHVELQPGNPNTVYAWCSHLQRKPWTIESGGREGGFYKSTDGGEHFTKITAGLPSELIGKGHIGVSAADPKRVYVFVEAKPGSGIYRSDDAGQTFAFVNSQPPAIAAQMIYRPFYYDTFGVDPMNADVLFTGAEGFWKSSDGGKTFATLRVPHGDNHDIWVNPTNDQILIEANDGGAVVSTDGGRTWSTQNNQPTAEIYGVWTDNQFPYKLYGAQQDSNTVIISSNAEPFNLTDWRAGPGCETGPIMPKPDNPDIVYGSCKGQYGVMDLKTGQEQNYWIGAQSLYGNPASDLIYRFQRVSPMATSPWDPNVLYYGSQYLHRTRDKGVTWEKISPDLTADDPCCQGVSGGPITRDVTGEEFYSTLYAISESPLEKGVIWTGSNDGPFYVTRDDGKTWTNVTPKDLPAGGRVQYIDPSPRRKGSAYFAVYRYLLGDYQPYLYRTDDYGKTWTRLTDGKNGIPADWPTRVVREDPTREGLLYAGTEFGLFISYDNGGHWQPFQLNLPRVPVTDIKIHDGDLIVSTQGRAFWILDNISSVEQGPSPAAPSVQGAPAATAVRLYKPWDGYRTRVSPNLYGPMIEYYLPTAPSGPVVLDILDAKNAVVSSYRSDTAAGGGAGGRGRGGRGGGAGASAAAGAGDTPQAVDPEAAGGGGFGRGRGAGVTSRVTTTVGLNRVLWDMRDKASGLTLPPGSYVARLTVNGAAETQPFTVRIDPIEAEDGLTVADLVEQFDHNLQMRELVSSVADVLTRVRTARSQLANATGADADKAKRIEAIYETIVATPEGVRYNKPGLQEHITYLAGMTTRTDQKIGRDAIDRYQTLKKQLDDIRTELDRLLR